VSSKYQTVELLPHGSLVVVTSLKYHLLFSTWSFGAPSRVNRARGSRTRKRRYRSCSQAVEFRFVFPIENSLTGTVKRVEKNNGARHGEDSRRNARCFCSRLRQSSRLWTRERRLSGSSGDRLAAAFNGESDEVALAFRSYEAQHCSGFIVVACSERVKTGMNATSRRDSKPLRTIQSEIFKTRQDRCPVSKACFLSSHTRRYWSKARSGNRPASLVIWLPEKSH
jgi:hypothetical protein